MPNRTPLLTQFSKSRYLRLPLKHYSKLYSAFVILSLASTFGCGTTATNIDECRDIEYARCEQAVYCGYEASVSSCQSYYKDHCLHGLPSGSDRTSTQVEQCTSDIAKAGACAQTDSDASAASCGLAVIVTEPPTVCQVIKTPSQLKSCSFLIVPADAQ